MRVRPLQAHYLTMTMPHIDGEELERYCMGGITGEADLDRIEGHVFVCELCGNRAWGLGKFVDTMAAASAVLRRIGAMDEEVKLTVAPGAMLSLSHAGWLDPRYTFVLDGGDLSCMGAQAEFLMSRRFDVGWRDVYPALRTAADRDLALKLLWEERVHGWWNLRDALMASGACTDLEFEAALTAWIEERKNSSPSG